MGVLTGPIQPKSLFCGWPCSVRAVRLCDPSSLEAAACLAKVGNAIHRVTIGVPPGYPSNSRQTSSPLRWPREMVDPCLQSFLPFIISPGKAISTSGFANSQIIFTLALHNLGPIASGLMPLGLMQLPCPEVPGRARDKSSSWRAFSVIDNDEYAAIVRDPMEQ